MAGSRRSSGQGGTRKGARRGDDWRDRTQDGFEEDHAPERERRAPARTSRKRPAREEEPGAKKRKFTLWSAIWYVATIPFRLIFHLTRNAKWYLLWPLRIGLSFAFVGAVVAAIFIIQYGSEANRYDITEVLKMPERTIVLDRKNREIGRLHGENRKRIKLEEIPPVFIDALLLREDSRFYSHSGVDVMGVARAVHQLFKHKRATQGASTLTMQLAKTTFNHQERNIHAKLTEVALAKRIESTYTKDQILEAYINRIFWGHTFMGLSAASRGYFSKIPSELTVGECAMLAGIIYGPNEFSPYKNPDKAKHARDIVLGLLKEKGKISDEQYQAALAEPIVTKRPESRSEENYTMDLIRKELDNILEDEDIRLGGLVVRTTLDLDLQNAAIDALNERLDQLEAVKGYRHPTRKAFLALPAETRAATTPNYVQGAVVVIDNSTGALIVVVGGRDAEESRFNRAIQSRRQVGSLFKPFVYSAFFEKGFTPSTAVSDNRIAPGEIRGAPRWSPRNADNNYTGSKPASYGLVKSRNTMSVRVGQYAGLTKVVEHARLCGFQGRISMTPSLFLGTWEASPLDVASAYTVFANGGVRPTPYIIETIADSNDNALFFSRKTSRQAYSSRAANMTSGLLQQVTKPGGTAGQMVAMGFKAPCGGKTGTTNNYTNAWFAGFTSELTGCVWVGFDKQRMIVDRGYGAVLALPVWVQIMKKAEQSGYPCRTIRTRPAAPTKVYLLCRDSNQIAHSGCQAAHTAYYETMPVNAPTKMCDVHIPAALPVQNEETIPVAEPVGPYAPNEEEPPLAIPVEEEEAIPVAIPVT